MPRRRLPYLRPYLRRRGPLAISRIDNYCASIDDTEHSRLYPHWHSRFGRSKIVDQWPNNPEGHRCQDYERNNNDSALPQQTAEITSRSTVSRFVAVP